MKEVTLSTGQVIRFEALTIEQAQMALEVSNQPEGMKFSELLLERQRIIAIAMANAGMSTDEAMLILDECPFPEIGSLFSDVADYTFLIRGGSSLEN